MGDTPPTPPELTIINSNAPNLQARCIRCKGELRDVTLVLKDENDDPTPFLIGYYCIQPRCTAFGVLTVAHIP